MVRLGVASLTTGVAMAAVGAAVVAAGAAVVAAGAAVVAFGVALVTLGVVPEPAALLLLPPLSHTQSMYTYHGAPCTASQ